MRAEQITERLGGKRTLGEKSAMAWRMVLKLPRLKKLMRREPVFIVGCGRSGTTMLLSILSADPQIFSVSEETECFANMNGDSPLALWWRRVRLYGHILKQETPIVDQVRYVEKTPRHVRDIDLILKAYGGKVRLARHASPGGIGGGTVASRCASRPPAASR